MTLLRLRQCLAEGYPAVFGFFLHKDFWTWTKDAESGFWTLPSLPSKKGPSSEMEGHAVLAVGFDDGGKRILCQNSWGASDETEGAPLFWIGYEYVKDFEATSNFWMVRLSKKED